MITYKLFLEAFDSTYQITRINDSRWSFTDDSGIEYNVIIDEEYDNVFDISFGNQVASGGSSVKRTKYKLTGTSKSPLKVYSTVRKIAHEFIKKRRNDIDNITFTAADSKTNSLYRKFADEIARRHNGVVHQSINGNGQASFDIRLKAAY